MRRHPHLSKSEYYRGVRMHPYDLVKELTIATAAMLAVVLVLAAVLSSPDVPSVTIQSWANADPVDFVTTAAAELGGTSLSARYGPPYNHQSNSVQSLGAFTPQEWFGVHVPVDPPVDFVLQPLSESAPGDPQLATALATYQAASTAQKERWLSAYTAALAAATAQGGAIQVASGDYGPLPTMMDSMLRLGQSGAMDGLLLSGHHFYATDYSLPLLFMADGGYLPGLAQQQKLTGSLWGMMNETGRYPGQAWLWLYTFWYQIPPYNTASNADLLVVLTMTLFTVLLMLVPFIPGLRDIPRRVPLHRLIWRNYYAEIQAAAWARQGDPASSG